MYHNLRLTNLDFYTIKIENPFSDLGDNFLMTC